MGTQPTFNGTLLQIAEPALQSLSCYLIQISNQSSLGRLYSGIIDSTPLGRVRRGIITKLCDEAPSPPVVQQGGRCPKNYDVITNVSYFDTFFAERIEDTTSVPSRVLGPISAPFFSSLDVPQGYVAAGVLNGAGVFSPTSPSIYDRVRCRGFRILSHSVVPVTGADNCGDGTAIPPGWYPDLEGDAWIFNINQNTLAINGDAYIGGGIQLSIPLDISTPYIPVNINGEVALTVGIGGITVTPTFAGNFDFGSTNNISGSIQNQITGTFQNTVDIEVELEELKQDGIDCSLDPGVLAQLEARCNDAEVPYSSWGDVIDVLTGNQVQIQQILCDAGTGEKEQIGGGTTTIGQRVFYFDVVPGQYRSVEMEITGTFPSKLNYYQTNEATGNFGAIAPTIGGFAGDQVAVFNRKTAIIDFPKKASGVRVFLFPGLTFLLRGIR